MSVTGTIAALELNICGLIISIPLMSICCVEGTVLEDAGNAKMSMRRTDSS